MQSQASLFWLLVAALAVIVAAGMQWDTATAERWLPEILHESSVQWCMVSIGFMMNFIAACMVCAGVKSSARLASTEKAVKPKKEVQIRERAESTGETGREESSWLDLCCARSPGGSSAVSRQNSYAGGDDEPAWLQDDSALHPKFCGYRLKEPGTMPNLTRFPAEPLGSNVPSHWEFMLPNCGDNERMKCRELRERVKNVRGAKDPITMLRFLRARQGSVSSAAKMYQDAMRWREGTGYELGFRLNNKDDLLHRKVDSCWPPTAILGKDYDGDPVYWNRMGLGNLDFLEKAPADFLIQHEVYTIARIMQAMEEASRMNNRPIMYMTVVADLGEMSWRSFNLKGIMKYKVCVRTLEDNFPELVKRIIAIRVPRLAYTLWNIASHFFDEGTRAKIQIADGNNTMKVLSEFMDPKWVPEALGGTHRINNSSWCKPCIPSPTGPPSPETMRSLDSTFGDT
ncbi:unnamed protein product [Effrenium voratum]|uniref:CRAL-TRIO domain-containing protein n=1 Tax=Effrenium voratum TaxID=2562239 RepID=A0AA36MKL0_9DINO|nr:unnamed protein product [Effrenium voratum]CAJ1452937.1 unnamed protein product [Effrenium voratum]